MRSLRTALKDSGLAGCPSGLLGLNPFYLSGTDHTTQQLARKSFGYRALSEVIHALRWPHGFDGLSDHPANNDEAWQHNPEGIVHDGQIWFITSQDKGLVTLPLSTDMDELSTNHFDNRHSNVPLGNGATYSLLTGGDDNQIIQINPPSGYHHMGGLAIQRLGARSVLYIPIQRGDPSFVDLIENTKSPPIIYALEVIGSQSIVDHNWRALIPLSGDQGAWCAFDPVANRLYSSDFYGGAPGSSIDVYSIATDGQADIGTPQAGQPFYTHFIGQLPLYEQDGVTPAKLQHIQSGFVTPNRHLYLVQDDGTGVVGFDLISGRKRIVISVDYDYDPSSKFYQEIEGACLFSDPPAPGMSGDIHVQLYENGAHAGPLGKGEKLWIKHYGIRDKSEREFI